MKGLAILGSTGSIGRQTLDIVRKFPDQFSVVGLAAGRNLTLLKEQIEEFKPELVFCQSVSEENAMLTLNDVTFANMEEMVAHPDVDLVMVATMGAAGLRPTLKALEIGKAVAIADKEVIVMAGELVTQIAEQHGAPLIPVDSEPSAIWQCLQGEPKAVSRLFLTASGGPFRTLPLKELENVTPEQALKHPVWRMGKKISVDSATLMNKGFEVLELTWLFKIPWERIEVIIHPQSIIHSMVEFADGAIKAHMGPPDMRLPIQYSLFHPQRITNDTLPKLDMTVPMSITWEPMDPTRYPCFSLVVEAARQGATYPTALSAADEVTVESFLSGRIGFLDIYRIIATVLEEHVPVKSDSLDNILAVDSWARQRALDLVKR